MTSEMENPAPDADYFGLDERKGPSPYFLLGIYMIACLGFFAWGKEFGLLQIDFGHGGIATLLSIASAGALYGYLLWRNGRPGLQEAYGFSPRASELGLSILLFLLLPLVLGLGGYSGAVRIANCVLDTSVPRERNVKRLTAVPTRSKMEGGKRGWFYVQDGDDRFWISVRRADFYELRDSSEIKVTTRSGAFGGEWLVSAEHP